MLRKSWLPLTHGWLSKKQNGWVIGRTGQETRVSGGSKFKDNNHSSKKIMKKKKWIIHSIIIVLLLPVFWYLVISRQDKIRKTHTPIIKETSIQGRIKKVVNNRGTYFEMTDGRLYIEGSFFVNEYKRRYGDDLKANDSINKKENSDTLLIIRGDKTYVYTFWY